MSGFLRSASAKINTPQSIALFAFLLPIVPLHLDSRLEMEQPKCLPYTWKKMLLFSYVGERYYIVLDRILDRYVYRSDLMQSISKNMYST